VRPAAQASIPGEAEFGHRLVSLDDEDRPLFGDTALERWRARRRQERTSSRIATGSAANERVRDHFQALPPEDVVAAQSVEDVRRTIAIYRALVGAGQHAAASDLYERRLHDVLTDRIGAHATVAELIGELKTDAARWVLAEAHRYLRRYEDAIAIWEPFLGDTLAAVNARSGQRLAPMLRNIGLVLQHSGSLLPAGRCFALADRVDGAAGRDSTAMGLFRHAELEWHRGCVAEALALLVRASPV
jgi:tetratricopeptide (TPR) repeat protein